MINTVHVGIGPIGQKMVKYSVERGCFNIVGAVDPDPDKAGKDINTGYKPISKGMASGVHQVGRSFIGDKEVVVLNFKAAAGEPESYEQVHIDGEPAIQSKIAGGVNGDIATCAITLNAVRSVLAARAGLKTMGDIPPVTFFTETAV